MKVCDNVPISLILVHMSCHMRFKLWVKMPTCPATSQLSWEKPQSAWEADIAGLAEVLQTATLLSGWIEPKLLQMMCILPCYTMLHCPCYTMPQSLLTCDHPPLAKYHLTLHHPPSSLIHIPSSLPGMSSSLLPPIIHSQQEDNIYL